MGKTKTRYKGTLTLLFPRNRILRRRNVRRGVTFPLTSFSEVFWMPLRVGMSSAEGKRLDNARRESMAGGCNHVWPRAGRIWSSASVRRGDAIRKWAECVSYT